MEKVIVILGGFHGVYINGRIQAQGVMDKKSLTRFISPDTTIFINGSDEDFVYLQDYGELPKYIGGVVGFLHHQKESKYINSIGNGSL